jgi:hypothetical protein
VLIYFAHEAAGATGTRLSLRPLFSEGGIFQSQLGRIARRDRGFAADVIASASEAIHSFLVW